jgi:hypothetical protein
LISDFRFLISEFAEGLAASGRLGIGVMLLEPEGGLLFNDRGLSAGELIP